MKTEVYSWRLTPSQRARLERAARRRKVKLAQVLGMAVEDWLAKNESAMGDDDEQQRLHAIAKRLVGTISSGNPHGSKRVREIVREHVAKKYGR